MHKALLLALLLAPVSCRYNPSPVPIEGSASDIARLAGTWDGDYSSAESGRSGSITFTILAGRDTAFGDVVMIPEHGQPLTAADAATPLHHMHEQSATLLRVTLVRVQDGTIRGELEPYIAPDCHCTVTTVFRGALTGDRVEGRYVTRGPDGLLQEGRWALARRKP